MRALALPALLVGCAVPSTPKALHHAHAGHDSAVVTDDTGGDTDTDSDTDADTDADTDSDTDADTDTDTGNGANPQGVDVSHWDDTIDWPTVYADGYDFGYAKATEGTGFIDPAFATNFAGMADAGVVRGAYHFAEPDSSDGATQADFFVDNGGDWLDDGQTMPGALDIEWNPYGSDCYGLSQSEMRTWIGDFVREYVARTGREPAIYCGQTWWTECVGAGDFSASALWVSSWDDATPNLPSGWTDWTFWQTGGGPVAGVGASTCDENVYNGSRAALIRFVDGR